jgi:hypothetical protein
MYSNSYVVYESLLHDCKIWPSFRPLSVCLTGLVYA